MASACGWCFVIGPVTSSMAQRSVTDLVSWFARVSDSTKAGSSLLTSASIAANPRPYEASPVITWTVYCLTTITSDMTRRPSLANDSAPPPLTAARPSLRA
jgi:hypothetical protein